MTGGKDGRVPLVRLREALPASVPGRGAEPGEGKPGCGLRGGCGLSRPVRGQPPSSAPPADRGRGAEAGAARGPPERGRGGGGPGERGLRGWGSLVPPALLPAGLGAARHERLEARRAAGGSGGSGYRGSAGPGARFAASLWGNPKIRFIARWFWLPGVRGGVRAPGRCVNRPGTGGLCWGSCFPCPVPRARRGRAGALRLLPQASPGTVTGDCGYKLEHGRFHWKMRRKLLGVRVSKPPSACLLL